MSEAILLVPGLFGFGRIGEISYFDKVAPLLAASAGIPEDRVFVLQPPPTGPLWRRVQCLHEKVEDLRGTFSTVHLVGHSTGGLDVRLYTNDAYLWPGGPSGDDRSEFFGAIGRVVSISAPHRGTPIAARLRGAMENVIPFLFLFSILAKADQRALLKEAMQPLTMAFAAAKKGVLPRSHVETTLVLSGVPPNTAREVDEFLSTIIDDHALIHDLTPLAMAALNAQLAGGRQLPVACFVTCSPPPWPGVARLSLGSPWVLTPLQRTIYTLSYENARPIDAPFPRGPWVGDVKPPMLDRIAATAQDGVVPCASQAMGQVAGIVYGDHLDVVGHYREQNGGETVFDSGASFDDARMQALWSAVAAVIRAKKVPFARTG